MEILEGTCTVQVKRSTEESRGIIQIATQAEVNAGLDDTKAITPKKLKEILKEFECNCEKPEVIEPKFIKLTDLPATSGGNIARRAIPIEQDKFLVTKSGKFQIYDRVTNTYTETALGFTTSGIVRLRYAYLQKSPNGNTLTTMENYTHLVVATYQNASRQLFVIDRAMNNMINLKDYDFSGVEIYSAHAFVKDSVQYIRVGSHAVGSGLYDFTNMKLVYRDSAHNNLATLVNSTPNYLDIMRLQNPSNGNFLEYGRGHGWDNKNYAYISEPSNSKLFSLLTPTLVNYEIYITQMFQRAHKGYSYIAFNFVSSIKLWAVDFETMELTGVESEFVFGVDKHFDENYIMEDGDLYFDHKVGRFIVATRHKVTGSVKIIFLKVEDNGSLSVDTAASIENHTSSVTGMVIRSEFDDKLYFKCRYHLALASQRGHYRLTPYKH